MQVQEILPVNGLTWSEIILGVLFPLVLGAYAYGWMSAHSLWAGIKDMETKIVARLDGLDKGILARIQERLEDLARVEGRLVSLEANDLRHLEERVKRLEDR